jgi:hypothetical protein
MVAFEGVKDQAAFAKEEGAPAELGDDMHFPFPGLGAANQNGTLGEANLELICPRRKRRTTDLEAEWNIRAYDCLSLPVSRRNRQQG